MNTASNIVESRMDSIPTTTPAHANFDSLGDGDKMKALAWMGKGDVQIVETNKPQILSSTDAVLRVTGTTVCGSGASSGPF